MSASRTLILGEAPSATSDPGRPLSGRSGERLERAAGFPPGSLRLRFDVANLLRDFPGAGGRKGSLWPREDARAAAKLLAIALEDPKAPAKVVLLGKRVAAAFGERRLAPLRWEVRDFGGRAVMIALVPHPSGVNRWWNSAANARAAGEFLRDACSP